MSEKETTKPEVTQEVKSEGGDMKIKSKPKKFTQKDEPVKVDLRKDPNVKVEEPVKVDLTKKEKDDAIQIGETKEVPVGDKPEASKKVDGEVRVSNTDEVQKSESPIVELNKEEQEQVKKVQESVKKVETRLDNKILKDRGNLIQERIWKYEDRYDGKKMPDTIKEVVRDLQKELDDINKKLDKGKTND